MCSTFEISTLKDQYGPGPRIENKDHQGHTLKLKLICEQILISLTGTQHVKNLERPTVFVGF